MRADDHHHPPDHVTLRWRAFRQAHEPGERSAAGARVRVDFCLYHEQRNITRRQRAEYVGP